MKKNYCLQIFKTETSGGSTPILGPFTYSFSLTRPIRILSYFGQAVYRNAALSSPSPLPASFTLQALGTTIMAQPPGTTVSGGVTQQTDSITKTFGGSFGDGTSPLIFVGGLFVPIPSTINFIASAWTSFALNDTCTFYHTLTFQYADINEEL